MKILLIIVFLFTNYAFAETVTSDSGRTKQIPAQDAVYSRPFISKASSLSTSIGGYAEANTNYFNTDGVSEGFSIEMRRFNIFLFSSIYRGLKFLSELEFEHGTEEIRLETAQLDLEIFNELSLRGGIILIPIGGFNLNHDSPKWDIVDRPLVSTTIIPSTLSEPAFGIYGKTSIPFNSTLTYSGYISNGLSDNVVLNSQGRTFLPSGKSEEIFAEDNNGSPALSGRVSTILPFGEIGISYYTCIYNKYIIEDEKVTEPMHLSISALDFSFDFYNFKLNGEFVYNQIDVNKDISEMFGTKQFGFFTDLSYPIFKGKLGLFDKTEINAIIRFENVDYNIGRFNATGDNIFDENWGITIGTGIRPTSNTVIKINYKYNWIRDFLGNPVIYSAGIQFGFATYF